MAALAKQLDPGTVATRFADLAEAGSDIARTDVGADQLPELVELALRGKALPIESVNFAPPLTRTSSPDFALIRRTVAETIEASEAEDASAAPMNSSTSFPATDPPAPTGEITVPGSGATSDNSPSPSPAPRAETPVCRVS